MFTATSEKAPHELTKVAIDAFLTFEKANGVSKDCLRQRKTHVTALYKWLNGELLTYAGLRVWRQSLVDQGYASITVLNYVKSVNRYLDYAGRSDLRFSQGRPKDIKDQEFGYLTAISPTGEKKRGDIVWRCQCRCGNIVDLPATRLLTGNTTSCGCLLISALQKANQYIDHTSLRAALEDDSKSNRAISGYTGVSPKRGKWQAGITYKGKHYSLGCYSRIKDAAKARAVAKEMIREDAKKLQVLYEQFHKNDPPPPLRKKSRTNMAPTMP